MGATANGSPACIQVGCDGWQSVRSRGLLHAPPAAGEDARLQAYAASLDVVELRESSGHLPTADRVQALMSAVPEHFRFMVHVPRSITHGRRLRDCGAALARLAARLRPLGERLGGLVFDLPDSPRADPGRLQAVLACRTSLTPWFFDLRGAWAAAAAQQTVLEAGGFLIRSEIGTTRGDTGHGHLYVRLSSPAPPALTVLRDWASRARSVAAQGVPVTLIYQRASIDEGLDTARRLRLVIEEQEVDTPGAQSALR